MGNGVDEGVKVEGREVRILCLDEDNGRGVVPGKVDVERETVVEVGEGYAVLSADWLANYDLVNVIEFIPILLPGKEVTKLIQKERERERERERLPNECLVFHKRLKLRSSRDGKVQSFGCEERFHVKQVEIVVVH